MPVRTTPGVFVEDVSGLPPPVTEVATAIPAFVGYTGKATRLVAGDLSGCPTRIGNLAEFEALFGQAAPSVVRQVVVDDAGHFVSASVCAPYLLHHSLRLFFANGGGACYVVSVGLYQGVAPDPQALLSGINQLASLDEPTLLACPDAALLDAPALGAVDQAMLQQSHDLQDRFAVLDTRLDDSAGQDFRDHVGNLAPSWGAAYTPWLMVQHLQPVSYAGLRGVLRRRGQPITWHQLTQDAEVLARLQALDKAVETGVVAEVAHLQNWLEKNFSPYSSVVSGVCAAPIACPPSGAVIGVMVAMDAQRGVWKAPANVAFKGVQAPAMLLDDGQAEALTLGSPSINTIRSFTGKGTVVWGARTLAGHDNEWRYVPVRRFFIMVEQSLKKSIAWVVFEPNSASTWARVQTMIDNYLTLKWRDGALVGAKPDHAFFVRCGLNETMTAQDVLEGRLNVEIGLAVVRPAEFIILRLSHQVLGA